jgi:thiamine pyrophosphate-dependent acetolactate synthase large subunit-like protein
LRDLIAGFLNNDISRRHFLEKVTLSGFSAVAANAILQSLEPLTAAAGTSAHPGPDSEVIRGTGGEILAAQLAAADAKFVVVGNSSHSRGLYDALVDHDRLHLILATEEGQVVAIASGYAMASGRLGVAMMSVAGAPHASSNMYNAISARLPLLVMTDMVPTEFEDREGIYEGRILLGAAGATSKWHWLVSQAELIPDITRRAIKFASTAPGGPALVTYPEDVLVRKDVSGSILPQQKFNVPAAIRATTHTVEAAAKMLLDAKNPCMYAGPEAWTSGARPECIELAELLGIPAMRALIDSWVDCFPTSHPLFVNAEHSPATRFPRSADVMLVLGRFVPSPGATKVIQVTMEAREINKGQPVELPLLADVKLTLRDIIDAIRSMAAPARLAALAAPRIELIKGFDASMQMSLNAVAKANWQKSPISWQRLAKELDAGIDRDALIVDELSTEKTKLFSYIRTRDGGRTRIGRSQEQALGWGVGLSIGAKLAEPDRQVVSVIGDGAFLFGGLPALWSMARYETPVITIVFNNRGYNEPRQRILGKMGKQGQTGKDMACYLGSPDISFARIASGFGIGGEVVTDPDGIAPALSRAIRATRDGKPYLLDVVIERTGIGADSVWYPRYSVAERRSRSV